MDEVVKPNQPESINNASPMLANQAEPLINLNEVNNQNNQDNLQPPMNNSNPTPVQNSQVYGQTPPKSHRTRNVLVTCGVLIILCCLIVCGVLIFAPSVITTAIAKASTGPDKSLTHIGTDEVSTVQTGLNTKLDNEQSQLSSTQTGQTISVKLSEKEFSYLLAKELNVSNNASQIGISADTGILKLEFPSSILLDSSSQNTDANTKKLLGSSYFSLYLGTASDKKSLIVNKFSTGNTLIDSIIPAKTKSDLQTQLNDSLKKDNNGLTIDTIDFQPQTIVITYLKSTSVTPPASVNPDPATQQ